MVGALIQLVLALYLATILSFKVKGGNLFKGLMFFPYLISGIAIRFRSRISEHDQRAVGTKLFQFGQIAGEH